MNDNGFNVGTVFGLGLMALIVFFVDCRPSFMHQTTSAKCAVVCYEREAAQWDYAERAHVCTCSDGRVYRMSVIARQVSR